jgi:hypothetical protein
LPTGTTGHLGVVAQRLIDRFLPEDIASPVERLALRFVWALVGVSSTFLITFGFLVGQSFPAMPSDPRPLTDFIALMVTLGTDFVIAMVLGLVMILFCCAYALAVAFSLHRRGPLGLLLGGATLPILLIALIRFGTT